MYRPIALLPSLLITVAFTILPQLGGAEPVAPENTCVNCHLNRQSGFSAGHAFGASNCIVCHAGNDRAAGEQLAHVGLIAYPGELANAERACGHCHADRVESVLRGLMHTGRGMVHKTRRLLDDNPEPDTNTDLQSLGHTVADSMLRKQCASCHLGQPKSSHSIDATTDRGGGCLACHVNEYPDAAHPALTRRVSSGRCFGCHSRSGRISLSYAGLAEVDVSESRLADGRPVSRLPADVHYISGMGCVDCHRADDVMGAAAGVLHQREAVDATCTDCHEGHQDDVRHERLTCATCHSQWAPQCFGCHMEYDADGEQWDHVERSVTPGRWHSRAWGVRNGLPPLGVNSAGEIDVFVPGMIITVSHPSWDSDRFFREFAPLSPHTIGASRSCESCHRSSEALGLGRGRLDERDGDYIFEPEMPSLQDGLPADAWTNLDNSLGGRASIDGERPLNPQEMKKIAEADVSDR
jgi:hypothetical protein